MRVNPVPTIEKLRTLRTNMLCSAIDGNYREFRKNSIQYAQEAVKHIELLPEVKGPTVQVPLFSKYGLKMLKVWFLNKLRIKTPSEKLLSNLMRKEKIKQKFNIQ